MPIANPEAMWTELVLLSQSVIQELGLVYGTSPVSVLPTDQVYAFKFPTDGYRVNLTPTGQPIKFPNVQVCPGPLEDVADSIQDFEDTQIILPVLVVLLFATNKTLAINNDLLYWRQQIYAAFEDFPDALSQTASLQISDITVWDCQITTKPVLDLATWQKENLDFSWLILNYKITRTRGRPGVTQ